MLLVHDRVHISFPETEDLKTKSYRRIEIIRLTTRAEILTAKSICFDRDSVPDNYGTVSGYKCRFNRRPFGPVSVSLCVRWQCTNLRGDPHHFTPSFRSMGPFS